LQHRTKSVALLLILSACGGEHAAGVDTGGAGLGPLSSTTDPVISQSSESEADPCLGTTTRLGDLYWPSDAPELCADDVPTQVSGNLFIESGVTELDGLSCLCEVHGDLILVGTELKNLNGMERLHLVSGEFDIADNQQLARLRGLEALTDVGTLTLRDNEALLKVALPSLLRVEQLVLENTVLVDLDGLASVQEVGALRLSGNSALVDVSGLQADLTELDYLTVSDNSVLTSLASLRIGVTGSIFVHDNPSLRDLEGLEGVTSLNYLEVHDNLLLDNLDALSGLNTVTYNLWISGNSALTSLAGLQSLTTVDTLYLDNNASLKDLSDLSGLRQLDTDLLITSNPSLTSVNGLANVETIGRNLLIENNAALSTCDAQELAYDSISHVYGSIEVTGNLADCAE
jgi:hypothetical protein